MEERRTIVVLFTCYRDVLSSFLHLASRRGYAHTSISLEEDSDFYYGFTLKGFRKEYPAQHKKRLRDKSAALHLGVSEEGYRQIKNRIMEVEEHAEDYRYTKLGIVLCFLRIPWRKEGRYFCSQFVSELLIAGGIPLRKRPSLYLPNQLAKELSGLPCVSRIELQVV